MLVQTKQIEHLCDEEIVGKWYDSININVPEGTCYSKQLKDIQNPIKTHALFKFQFGKREN